jgi:tetratricopeptide (TPR) repeat protein
MKLQTAQFRNDAGRASVLNNIRAALARSYFYLWEFEDAEKQARAAYEGRLILFGQYDLKTLGTEEDLSACLAELGQIEEAEKRLQSVLERLKEKFWESGYFVGRCEGKFSVDFDA